MGLSCPSFCSESRIKTHHKGFLDLFFPSEGQHDHNYSCIDNSYLPTKFKGEYHVGGILGQGATSQVYSVYHNQTGHRYACKFVDKTALRLKFEDEKEKNADLSAMCDQLRKETIILKEISHPNIVRFHEFFEDNNYLIITMDFLHGVDLFQYVFSHGPLPENVSLKYYIKFF